VKTILTALAFVPLAATAAFADEPAHPHAMVTPAEMSWGPAPPSLPRGAKASVLYGDPGKPGLFVIRLQFPAGYRIPAHTHPSDENVTVISGDLAVGMGDKLDPALAKSAPPGSNATMPAGMSHFVMVKKESVVQVTATGPFEVRYVDPADDPRKAAKR